MFRLQEEQKRQLGERGALDKAFDVELDRFEKEWAKRIQAVEDGCEQKVTIMEELHGVRRVDFDRELRAKVALMRYAFSRVSVSVDSVIYRERRGG